MAEIGWPCYLRRASRAFENVNMNVSLVTARAMCALTLLGVIVDVTAADTPTTEAGPLVWKLESVARVGDYVATVVGSPRVVREEGRPSLCFDGTSDAIFLPGSPIAGWTQFTIEALEPISISRVAATATDFVQD
jgi:hypothetical protein